MKLPNLTLFLFILLSFYDVQSDEVIFNDAKSDLELESPYIDVITIKIKYLKYVLNILLDVIYQKMEAIF